MSVISIQYNDGTAVFVRRSVIIGKTGKREIRLSRKIRFLSPASARRLYEHIALDRGRYITRAGPREWDYIPGCSVGNARREIVPE